MKRPGHIYLAGFMGTGKTVVGRRLAQRLGWEFIDLDDRVVEMRKRTVPEIFRTEGEEAFRQHEVSALESLSESPYAVVALGGGAPTVTRIANMIRESGQTVLLTADWKTVWARVKDDTARPLLQPFFGPAKGDRVADACAFAQFAQPILDRRRESYAAVADLTIDTSSLTVDAVVDRIAIWMDG